MILWVLGIIDIIAGAALALGGFFSYVNNFMIGLLALILILKGIWSVGLAAANHFYFDLIGLLDLASGILLVVATFGFFMDLFSMVGIALILEGIYTVVVGIIAIGR